MDDTDFTFDMLTKKQLIKFIDEYELPVSKSAPIEEILRTVKRLLKITNDGYILPKGQTKEGRGKEEDEPKPTRKLINVKIKILN